MSGCDGTEMSLAGCRLIFLRVRASGADISGERNRSTLAGSLNLCHPNMEIISHPRSQVDKNCVLSSRSFLLNAFESGKYTVASFLADEHTDDESDMFRARFPHAVPCDESFYFLPFMHI